MKHILIYTVLVFFISCLFTQCSDEQIPTGNDQEELSSLEKIIVDKYSFDVALDSEPPYENCATGENMKNYGTVMVHIVERTTPSGNLLLNGWVDYNAFTGVTLVNSGNGDVWTLTNGHNPFHEVSKVNGYYVLNYHFNELYKMNNKTLHILLKGHLKITPDGTVTIVRESYTCR